MIIKYNSLKSNRVACIGGVLFFGSGAFAAYYWNEPVLFHLCLLMFIAGIIAIFSSFYRYLFDVLDIKIDTEKKIINYNATSKYKQEYRKEIISFNQIKYVHVELATGKSGSDSIKFVTDKDLSFSIPIQHNQIKELEKFFDINYIMSAGDIEQITRKKNVKKLYKSGLLGSLFSLKGYFFLFLISILFILNLFVFLVPISLYLFNTGTSNYIISFVCVIELIIFCFIINVVWKIIR